MLIGCFEHNMDSKGRIIIPAKWRLDLGARIIVTCGFARKGDYQCLMGMSEERWNAFVNAVQNVSLADIVVQKALRKLFALACECELDKQGRILIAPSLRERRWTTSPASMTKRCLRLQGYRAAYERI